MKVSIKGMLRNAVRSQADEQLLKRLARMLWTLSQGRAGGEQVIDAFMRVYLVDLPLHSIIHSLPMRPTQTMAQPGLVRFGLEELHKNLVEVNARKAEGRAVIDEFFNLYVFEGASEW